MAQRRTLARNSAVTENNTAGGALSFTYNSLKNRVVFGRGSSVTQIHAELDRLGVSRAILVTGSGERELALRVAASAGSKVVTLFDKVRPHVPTATAEQARRVAADNTVDGIVCVGGGSTTGTAKAIALTTHLPILAVPTTYAGSEVTPVWGMTADGMKTTGRALEVLPKVVVYDPDLVEFLPTSLAVASALNAMAHCLESLWVPTRSPISDLIALEGSRVLTSGLLKLVSEQPEAAAELLLHGAYLAGTAFAATGSGLHHTICHALGGLFDLPHADTHAVVLPHVLRFNIGNLSDIADAMLPGLPGKDAVDRLTHLYAAVGAPASLRQLGLNAIDVDRATIDISAKLPIGNIHPVSPDTVAQILSDAYEGVGHHAAQRY